jgi:hypothetical protein
MANGEVCKHCNYQETDHNLGKARAENDEPCTDFESTFEHKPECSVLGCNGNCDAMIARQRREEETAGFGGCIVLITPGFTLYWGD